VLAGLGADIIKIEKRGVGDPSRNATRFRQHDVDANFIAYNRGKRSIAIAYDTEDGRSLVRRLAAVADVFVEDFIPGTVGRWQLDWETVRTDNPKLVYCAITTYGQTGPYAQDVGYDMNVQAFGGGMSMTGLAEGPPVLMGFTIGEIVGSLFAATSVVAALRARDQSGLGDYLDVSMADCQVAAGGPFLQYYLTDGFVHGFRGSADPLTPATMLVRGADNEPFYVAAIEDKHFLGLVEVIEQPSLASDPRFATFKSRRANRIELNQLIGTSFSARSRREWLDRLRSVGVPASPVNSIDDVVDDAHTREREMIVEVDHPALGSFRVPAFPVEFAHYRRAFHPSLVPAMYGEHTTEVLTQVLGLTLEEVRDLTKDGIIE
jgi:crotonobetainyl-CoA:carnitine CoA-transferase CaiB-like acyl-CoA transferase